MNKNLENRIDYFVHDSGKDRIQIQDKESQKPVYILSPSDVDDEIDLLQLLLPPIKYKIQLALVVLICIALYLVFTLSCGVLTYSDFLIFKTKPHAFLKFNPQTQFFTEPELIRARDTLGSIWDLSDVESSMELVGYFDQDSTRKDSVLSIRNKTWDNEALPANTYLLYVATKNVDKTGEALDSLYGYFDSRNKDIATETADRQLSKLKINKQRIVSEFKSSISLIDDVKYIAFGVNQYFVLKRNDTVTIIIKRSEQDDRIIEYDLGFLDTVGNSSEIAEIRKVVALSETVDSLPVKLSKLVDQYEESARKIADIRPAITKNNFILGYLEADAISKGEQYETYQSQTDRLNNEITELRSRLSPLDARVASLTSEYNNNLSLLKIYMYFSLMYPTTEKNSWIVTNIAGENVITDPNDQIEIRAKNTIKLGAIETVLSNISSVYSKIASNVANKLLIDESFLSPYEIVLSPGDTEGHTSARILSFEFLNGDKTSYNNSESNRLDIMKSAVRSKKSLAIVFMIALFVGIISVYCRQMMKNKGGILYNPSFIEAVKYHRL